MLCENCNKNEANVHTVSIVNGEKQEHHFCDECAKSMQFALPSIMNLLSGFYVQPQQSMAEVCDCGNGITNFQKTGRLGCPQCYTTYRSVLMPVIKRVQGGRTRHVGRRPSEYGAVLQEAADIRQQAEAAPPTPEQECARLRAELQSAIREERYERAAELRDRLRTLEGRENT